MRAFQDDAARCFLHWRPRMAMRARELARQRQHTVAQQRAQCFGTHSKEAPRGLAIHSISAGSRREMISHYMGDNITAPHYHCRCCRVGPRRMPSALRRDYHYRADSVTTLPDAMPARSPRTGHSYVEQHTRPPATAAKDARKPRVYRGRIRCYYFRTMRPLLLPAMADFHRRGDFEKELT